MIRKQGGFTLTELIVVIVILGLIASSAGLVLTRAFTSANKFNATNDPNYWQGTIAYERMVRDLREMVALVTANPTSITYLNNTGNTITYSLSGSSQLLRSVAPAAPASGTVLSTAITSLGFTYYKSNGQVATSVSNVNCINVMTTLTQPTQTGSVLRTLVCPRSFLH